MNISTQQSNTNYTDMTEGSEQHDLSAMQSIMQTVQRYTNLASLMRLCGLGLMLIAMIMFLSNQWANSADISRFYMLLIQTGLLAAGGFMLSYIVKENKGARLLFGISLVSVVANITTLAALIYFVTHAGLQTSQYPVIALWKANSVDVIYAAIVAACICVPVVIFAFRLLTRNSSTSFALAFFLCNLLLLMPIREGLLMVAIVIATLAIPAYILAKEIKHNIRLRTIEGNAAMAILFIPATIITVRSIWLYDISSLMLFMMTFAAFVTLRHIVRDMDRTSFISVGIDIVSTILAFIIGVCCMDLLRPFVEHGITQCLGWFLMAGLVISAARTSHIRKSLTGITVFMFCSVHIMNAINTYGDFSGILAILAGIFVISYAAHPESKMQRRYGLLTAIIGIIVACVDLAAIIDMNNWITFSVFGAGIIISSSLLERHGTVIHQRLKKWI
jgi:hypothetical protein